jgi:hypothetical protein
MTSADGIFKQGSFSPELSLNILPRRYHVLHRQRRPLSFSFSVFDKIP